MKSFGRTAVIGLLVAMCFALTGCLTSVGAGHVGIVVNKAGSQRGVSDFPMTTGWVWYNPLATEVVAYPVNVQTAVWTRDTHEGHPQNEEITFTTKDALAVSADVSLSYSLESAKVPEFYVKFRADDLDTFTHGFLRNLARDKFNEIGGEYTVIDIMGDNGPFLQKVRAAIQMEIMPYGLRIEQLGFIGAPRPPASVVQAINEKVRATQLAQQKQNEVVQAQADAAKLVAQAEGEAQANRLRNSTITPQLLELKRLENQANAISRWDGRQPQVMSGSGGGLLLNLGSKE